jgi:NADPH:quinone reductase-like Zn-dependent oxidoreductase
LQPGAVVGRRLNLEGDALEDVGGVDLVLDVFGGEIGRRSAGIVRAGGTLVSIAGPPETRPADGLTIDFVVVSDGDQPGEIAARVRDGPPRANIGKVATLDDAVAAFNPPEPSNRKTVIRVRSWAPQQMTPTFDQLCPPTEPQIHRHHTQGARR